MANTKLWQQEIDDYTKVMGAYGEQYDAYVDSVGAFNNLPYVTSDGVLGRAGRLSDGRAYVGSGGVGDRVNVGTESSAQYIAPFSGEELTITGYTGTVASVPTAPAEPSKQMPTFTRAQASKLNNPDPSAADGARNSTSYVSRLKDAKDISGSAYTGSMDSGVGILQKVLTKKL